MRYEILRKKKFHVSLFSCRNYKNNESNENMTDEVMNFFLNAFNDEPISDFNELQVPLRNNKSFPRPLINRIGFATMERNHWT